MGDENIKKAFTAFFRSQFVSKLNYRFRFDWSYLLGSKLFLDLFTLDALITLAEIKMAIFELGADKVQGLDGIPLMFFQKLLGCG